MRGKSINLPVIIVVLSAIATFGLFYGVNWVLTARTVTGPLQTALGQVAGVSEVKVSQDDGVLRLDVRLSSVPNLCETYGRLIKTANGIVGRRRFELSIVDHRNPRLEEAYYNIHFDLQQAVFTGGFSNMATAVSEKAPALGIERYRLFVDAQKIYVQLHEGQDYLYEIVPRPEPTTGKPAAALSFGSLGF